MDEKGTLFNENLTKEENSISEKDCNDRESMLLNYIQNCPAVFKNQQRGDPELTTEEKREIAEDLLHKNPVTFLMKFGEYLEEEHLNYFLNRETKSYEIEYYVNRLKISLNDHNKKLIKRNRRYEAMKRLEAAGDYFSEEEMEKREPLLYHQMVGRYLSDKEKFIKNRQAKKDVIPTFSKFLLDKIEKDELGKLLKCQQEEEDAFKKEEMSSQLYECETPVVTEKRWGDDWEDEEKEKKKPKKPKHVKKEEHVVCPQEKKLLFEEFKSIMQNNFLNGKDSDFNYSEVDSNPEYDSLDLREQDEEEKYFDEETCDDTICTDTGIGDY